jgi:pimeloyl-ACP methyl ester carboxylesterase
MTRTADGARESTTGNITHRYLVGSGGLRLAADFGGDPDRQPVILLHGGGQTRHSWHHTMRKLMVRGYQVINLDARGHGESEWAPDGDYSLAALADDLMAVSETLPAPPALVGASMGGITSLCAVGRTTRKIASALVLVDVVPRIDPEGAARIRKFMQANPQGFATIDEAADAVAAYNPHRSRPRSTDGLMKNLRLREDGRLYWHWDPRLLTGAEMVEPPLMGPRLLALCDGVRVPTLLVHGTQSEIVSQAGVEEFRSRLPQLEVFDVPGAGHMVAGDRNDVFTEGILGFLVRHCPPIQTI